MVTLAQQNLVPRIAEPYPRLLKVSLILREAKLVGVPMKTIRKIRAFFSTQKPETTLADDSCSARYTWSEAQAAEKRHSSALWEDFGSANRQSTSLGERLKNIFLVNSLENFLGKTIEEILDGKRVLDIACGPVSYISTLKGAASIEGVDPLEYPSWVYTQYNRRDFTVHLCRLEDLKAEPYDIVVCYNALQHFDNLQAAAASIERLLVPGGKCQIIDYLKVPTDEAHLLFLTKEGLDSAFASARLQVRSEERKVRLPGLVETSNRKPISVYLGDITKPSA